MPPYGSWTDDEWWNCENGGGDALIEKRGALRRRRKRKFSLLVYPPAGERAAACIRASAEEHSGSEPVWVLLFSVSFFRDDVRLCFPWIKNRTGP